MAQAIFDETLPALQIQENSTLPAAEVVTSTNADLVGQTYHCQDSVVQIVSIDPGHPEKYVIVQDLRTEKRWSVPAGVIRLALGSKRSRRKKAA